MLELEELSVFVSVALHKSFSVAARELYLSQATISTRIKSLESKLGLPLFVRSRSRVEITQAGTLLLPYARQMLTVEQEAENALLYLKTGRHGSLTLAASHTLYSWILPVIVRRLRQKYPDIEVRLNTAFTNETIQMVDSGQAQFGVIRMPTSFFADSRFYSKLLEKDNTYFFALPTHHIFKYKHITLERLSCEPMLVYGSPTSYWTQIQEIFARVGVRPKVALELNDVQAVKFMVELGTGIGFLPELALKSELASGKFRAITVDDCPPIERYSFLIYQKSSVLTGVTKEFLDFINSLDILE